MKEITLEIPDDTAALHVLVAVDDDDNLILDSGFFHQKNLAEALDEKAVLSLKSAKRRKNED